MRMARKTSLARVEYDMYRRVKKLLKEDPEFRGPPKWNVTDLVTRIFAEWLDARERRKRKEKAA